MVAKVSLHVLLSMNEEGDYYFMPKKYISRNSAHINVHPITSYPLLIRWIPFKFKKMHAYTYNPRPCIAKGSTFSISSLFDVTKLQKKNCLDISSTAAFRSQCQWTRIFISLTDPMMMRTQIGFKRHRENRYSSQCYRKLWFRHYYQWKFLQVALPLWVLEVHINDITGVIFHITES